MQIQQRKTREDITEVVPQWCRYSRGRQEKIALKWYHSGADRAISILYFVIIPMGQSEQGAVGLKISSQSTANLHIHKLLQDSD